MSSHKYKINPDRLFIWLSLYIITAIPAYLKIYQTVPIYLGIILILEEVVCYYLLEDEFLQYCLELVKSQVITLALLAISMLIMLITFIWLLFYEWKLFMILGVVEIIAYLIRNYIKTYKSSRKS